jgi:hypothetical protein
VEIAFFGETVKAGAQEEEQGAVDDANALKALTCGSE